jgi:hypothetical protein
MTSVAGPGPDPQTAASRLTDAVNAANTLLYYAVSGGQDLPVAVRDPIIKARVALDRGATLSDDDEGKFLEAYSKLALRVSPVTAATLDATSRSHSRRGWAGQLLRLRPVSDAQRLVSRFGLLAVCLIVAIAAGEWTHTLLRSITAAEKQFATNAQEMRDANMKLSGIESQIKKLAPTATAQAESAAVNQALEAQKDQADTKLWSVEHANQELLDTINRSYDTLSGLLFLSHDHLKSVSVPLGIILGGFLLPVLYGALGTCAFVLRSLYREMVDRTFDGRRTGEFLVRIFLGMLSGLTLQWLVVRPDGTIAGGVTPAVLAFLGGYSVEMLFAAMDRLVQLVTGRMRSPHRAGQPAARAKRDLAQPGAHAGKRTRAREILANGAAGTQRAASPVTALAAVRAESN